MIYNSTRYNSSWDTKKLSEIGSFNRGRSRHRPRDDKRLFENGKYPLIQTGEIKSNNLYVTSHNSEYGEFGLKQSKLWPTGTLCITIAANIAETAILAYPMCFPDSVIGFNAYPKQVSELFMHYVFSYIRSAIQNSVSGSIQDNINKEYLEGLEFKIPLKNYQDKVVWMLSSIDKKIEINDCINTELETTAKLIYDYWFTQFDFPNAEGKPYKASGGEMAWNEELKIKIPKGWDVNQLRKIEPKIITGKTPPTNKPQYFNGEVPFITIGDIRGKMFITKTEKTLSELGANTQKKKYIREDSICVTCIASPGLIGIATESSQTNQQINTIICKKPYNRSYLYFGLKNFFKFSSGAKTGNTFANMNKEDFESILLIRPEEKIVELFHEQTEALFNKIKLLSKENCELIKLRDWLLPMLMNGQITVEDAEKIVTRAFKRKDEGYEVKQAARAMSKGKMADDTTDLVKEYLEHKRNEKGM